MELGGHAPVIVCEDADPVQAARASALAKFINAGQVCTSPSRFLVHQSIVDPFAEAFVQAAQAVVVGDGMEPKTQMGPLANARRLKAVEALVADAVGRGGKTLCGGRRLGNRGFFYAPTVLTGVPDDAQMMGVEPFGPLAPIRPFAGLDEAITITACPMAWPRTASRALRRRRTDWPVDWRRVSCRSTTRAVPSWRPPQAASRKAAMAARAATRGSTDT
jgi:succinate-semialdehyde dehydrogenase/glutarate-semialdehyde dehydrogenase